MRWARLRSTASASARPAAARGLSAEAHAAVSQPRGLEGTDAAARALRDAMERRVQDFQPGPRLGNTWREDVSLQRFAKTFLAESNEWDEVDQDLASFGAKCGAEYLKMADNAERFPPQLEQFNQWGQRVDRLHLAEGWRYFKRESAIEGLVSIPYEKRTPEARIHQVLKLMLFNPSGGMFGCPLAMTDGAALAIGGVLAEQDTLDARSSTGKLEDKTVAELRHAYKCLTTRDPDSFWTSGQWMTEKIGGSDLSRATQTFALERPSATSTHALYGYKWFTSAVDSEMTMTLASLSDEASPDLDRERKPLSLFYLRTHKDPNHLSPEDAALAGSGDLPLNNIKVQRLKDKMATRQLPTAELILEGAHAHLLSKEGSGIKAVSPMLTVTRLHTALSSVGYCIRMRNLAIDFAHTRKAFGKAIVDKPLHLQSLYEYDMDVRGSTLFVLEVARLLGLVETGKASAHEDALLRASTSLVKVFCSRELVRLMSEGVELFGAVGVMNNHMSTIFRDASVMPIWEGTSNTLSLDLLRVAAREPEALEAMFKELRSMAPGGDAGDALRAEVDKVFGYIKANAANLEGFEWNARRLTMNLSRLYICGLAARTAAKTGHKEDFAMYEYWLDRVTRQYEPMTDPAVHDTYRSTLSSKMNGAMRDEDGNIRSVL
ncbi:Acyl-CoA dehydrogenase family member 11 [Hondaea fermentalgiana]|uniref:Acyl-CoA dehydrogenase family member 11 n=1 Tax=Hondaea fermentalgiana TaxID=2315210 RepID=A0A2R5GLM3_9STRA|nr:Acyl-CoA dehydrogenase family member 11 [Hondaea fermentalgiana]|eukprot:GBG30638.1 Acyl-CoA dehydrogenase family member 11 [Hondaea fermentalgiana]